MEYWLSSQQVEFQRRIEAFVNREIVPIADDLQLQ